MKGGVLSNSKELIIMKRPKQRRFINRFVGECTDYGNKGNRGSKYTNRIIRKKLKKELRKEIKEIIKEMV